MDWKHWHCMDTTWHHWNFRATDWADTSPAPPLDRQKRVFGKAPLFLLRSTYSCSLNGGIHRLILKATFLCLTSWWFWIVFIFSVVQPWCDALQWPASSPTTNQLNPPWVLAFHPQLTAPSRAMSVLFAASFNIVSSAAELKLVSTSCQFRPRSWH